MDVTYDLYYFVGGLLVDLVLILVIGVILILTVAFLTLYERHILGQIQTRQGPNVVGLWGILQPIADGAKLGSKETITPSAAAKKLFFFIAVLSFIVAFLSFAALIWSPEGFFSFLNVPVLLIMALGGLSALTTLMAGWSSNSKYSFLGALRSTAQLIAYEISLGLIYLNVLILTQGRADFLGIVESQANIWFIFPLCPAALMFFICNLAETNRHPFDLPEAEAELVGGYNTEYSAFSFAFFFLAEYGHMLLVSALFSLFFLGGWSLSMFEPFFGGNSSWILAVKTIIVFYFVVWARAALPRYRYDQLMKTQWVTIIIGCLASIFVTIFLLSYWVGNSFDFIYILQSDWC